MRTHKLKLNGKEVTPREFHQGGKIGGEGIPMIPPNTYTDARPWVSESSGVLPRQVAEARESVANNKELTAVRVLDNGAVECTDRFDAGRRGWMKHRNKIDADGGYGETYEPK